ncbi:TLD-domain-containing protein [Tilletiaria anomala UBC 951]|uniref:Oxidation resistance protein 1 n=1 Tax=Tilletiaria anomala (strain ATCC 24038 / CBS 436.72 / UBC 951) TaxID=1037660 RepID=A0A066VRP5_TILAU|nr:TLD-domain-containing protein [Tilletiaria anomala UBC 951]KDN44372.1 TLD-domain-containing protein [Tilletiaria anomala UBC 951]
MDPTGHNAKAQPLPKSLAAHTWQPSDEFGNFEGAQMVAVSPNFDEAGPIGQTVAQHPQPPPSADDWTDGDVVASFSPIQTRFPAPPSGQPIETSAQDEAFFRALEQDAREKAARVPSPPMIDLRDVERKLSLTESKSEAIENEFSRSHRADSSADERFFAAFEIDAQPSGAGKPAGLSGTALEHMTEAQATPMDLKAKESQGWLDYLTGDEDSQAKSPQSAGSSSWSETAGHFAGGLKKTLGTLRHRAGDVMSHLPSASDFLVPPDDEEFHDFQAAMLPKHVQRTIPPDPRGQKTPEQSANPLVQNEGARRISQPDSTPTKSHSASNSSLSPSFGGGTGSWHANGSDSSSAPHHYPPPRAGSLPISGAPGFDAYLSATDQQWNTGHWKMEEKEKHRKYIPVSLTGRREETSEVIEQWHAARIQAALPPRLQLGKTWRLVYSLDQHGISLGTLYHNVAKALDPTLAKKSVAGLQDAEGWLRGASAETQGALGVGSGGGRVKHVGGGLALSDAGLVIGIRDAEDNVFGAFVNERLRPQPHYYGSGECFLWKTTCENSPQAPDVDTKSDSSDAHKRLKVYKWTGRNEYMIFTEAHFLSVGGGEGRFGLWIDDALENGVSSRCPAFDNDILCDGSSATTSVDAKEGRFECLGLEVWAVGTD